MQDAMRLMGRVVGMPAKALGLMAGASGDAKTLVNMAEKSGELLDRRRQIVRQMQVDQIINPRKKKGA